MILNLAKVMRSGKVESVHAGHLAVCDHRGRLLFAVGDPQHHFYWRSTAKPFQAMTLLRLGVPQHYGWSSRELALCCASHAGEAFHVALADQMLQSAGLNADALRLGKSMPLDDKTREQAIRSGEPASKLLNNCSGKHAGMLAACQFKNWPTETYLERTHPIQHANHRVIAEYLGVDPAALEVGVDGCGIPTFWVNGQQTATAFARLSCFAESDAGSTSPLNEPAEIERRRAICVAMTSHPELVAGTNRIDTDLMRFADGKVIAKLGAEGVYGLGIVGRGIGVSIKLADGSMRAYAAALQPVLEVLLPNLNWREFFTGCNPPLTNTLGNVIGSIESAYAVSDVTKIELQKAIELNSLPADSTSGRH